MELTPEQQALLQSEEVQEHIRKYVQEATQPLQAQYEQELQAEKAKLQQLRLSAMSDTERAKAELEIQRQEIARLQQQAEATRLENFAIQTLKQFGLSTDSKKFIMGQNELEIAEKARELSRLVSAQTQHQQQPRGATPAQNTRNPFAKESFNMTKQMELYRENPELAKRLAAQAGVRL